MLKKGSVATFRQMGLLTFRKWFNMLKEGKLATLRYFPSPLPSSIVNKNLFNSPFLNVMLLWAFNYKMNELSSAVVEPLIRY